MPSFAGLFGRKKKSTDTYAASSAGHSTKDDYVSNTSSPTTEYITPDKWVPSSPNGQSMFSQESGRTGKSSSVYPSLQSSPPGQLRVPGMARKKDGPTMSSSSLASAYTTADDRGSPYPTPPRPTYVKTHSRNGSRGSNAPSESERRRLGPPPSKSAIFAAYNDHPGALSTRSLPTERVSGKDQSPELPPVPTPAKKGFFSWGKSPSSSKSKEKEKSRPTVTPLQPAADIDSSFNLKSFRHVAPSNPLANNANVSSSSLVPPAIPRPRNGSTASDSSQRISVAAFREAQARRSTAGSPISSDRAPSPFGGNRAGVGAHKWPANTPISQKRRSGLAYTSDSTDEESSEEEESEDGDDQHSTIRGPGAPVKRKNTLTVRSESEPHLFKARATKSEAGHGSSFRPRPSFTDPPEPMPRAQSSNILSVPLTSSPRDAEFGANMDPPRSQSNLGFGDTARPRASISTSSAAPPSVAQQASNLANGNPETGRKGKHQARASSTSTATVQAWSNSVHTANHRRKVSSSSSESDYSEDDAPLATLVAPRRPGSAMSNASGASGRPGGGPKPLIDINELTKSKPITATSAKHNMDGFTGGKSTLISKRMSGEVASNNSSPPIPSKHNSPIVTSVEPPRQFVSPPSSPVKSTMKIDGPSPSPTTAQGTRVNVAGRLPPMRSGTQDSDALSIGSNPARSKSSEDFQARSRVGLQDRLNRVAQLKSDTRVPTTSFSSSTSVPATRDVQRSIPTVTPSASASAPATRTTSPPRVKHEPVKPEKLSPPDEDLVGLLGPAAISLISVSGAESEEDESSESEEEEEEEVPSPKDPNCIAPIPIKQRAPPAGFSVTSRPNRKPENNTSSNASSGAASNSSSTARTTKSVSPATGGGRQRSSTLFTTPSASLAPTPYKTPPSSSNASSVSATSSASGKPPVTPSTARPILRRDQDEKDTHTRQGPRQRSSTMIASVTPPSSSSNLGLGMPSINVIPDRPFAGRNDRRESPGTSSAGDSSSGRMPYTPKDGSEIGSVATSKAPGRGGRHQKTRSVSFEHDERSESEKPKTPKELEEKRKERRRSEAKAAIELGNIVNGKGPIIQDDDDDEDMPINQMYNGGPRMANPMMGMGNPAMMNMGPQMGNGGWNMGMPGFLGQQMPNPGFLSPQNFMPPVPPPNADPNFMVAHQQAMMYAKQAYQMAVAQQAMAAAGEEWERGSTIGFGSGGSVYGGGGGSVYGGISSGASAVGPPFSMGMGMPMNGWSGGSVIFPNSAAGSVYGGMSSARSDYGGVRNSRAWDSSKSVYGESFGPSQNRYGKSLGRDMGGLPPVPPIPQNNGRNSPVGAPRSRTTSQPANPSKAAGKRPPPSSWKTGF